MIYPGGKNACFRQIVNQIPPHDLFVEAFGGSAAVSFFKKPARENYVLEIEPRANYAAWWRLAAGKLPGTALEHKVIEGDALRWLSSGWLREDLDRAGRRAVVYLDPPYLLEARSSGREIYDREFHTAEEHAALLQLLKRLRCNVLISHYRSDLYDQSLKGWRRVDFRTGSRGGVKVESLYCNFQEPEQLHDYSFTGANKDFRQRTKRRIANLVSYLQTLPAVERNAVLDALNLELGQFSTTAKASAQSPATTVHRSSP